MALFSFGLVFTDHYILLCPDTGVNCSATLPCFFLNQKNKALSYTLRIIIFWWGFRLQLQVYVINSSIILDALFLYYDPWKEYCCDQWNLGSVCLRYAINDSDLISRVAN